MSDLPIIFCSSQFINGKNSTQSGGRTPHSDAARKYQNWKQIPREDRPLAHVLYEVSPVKAGWGGPVERGRGGQPGKGTA